MLSRSKGTWRSDNLDHVKSSIKTELSGPSYEEPKVRLKHVLSRAAALSDDSSPDALMHRWVYMMHALLIQKSYSLLPDYRVDAIAKSCLQMLNLQSIDPGASRMDFLHAELRTVLSQIYSRTGRPETAAWYQSLIVVAARRSQKEDPDGTWDLAHAHRLQRLGFVNQANSHFSKAVDRLAPGTRNHERALLGQLHDLRLLNDWPSFKEASEILKADPTLTPSAVNEVAWQDICADVTQSGSLDTMITSLKPGHPHHTAEYYYEGLLWFHAQQDQGQLKRADVVLRAGRGMLGKPKEMGFIGKSGRTLQELENLTLDRLEHVQRLTNLAIERQSCLRVDLEMLLLAALYRKFENLEAAEQMALARGLYESLSLRMTDLRTKDALGLLT